MATTNKPLFTSDHAERLRACDGEKYQPSNGTEGDMFREQWCEQCSKDNFNEDTGEGGCLILANVLFHLVTDPDYPSEWQYNPQGQPICTAFVVRQYPTPAGDGA